MIELHKAFNKLTGREDLYNIFNDFLDLTIALHGMNKKESEKTLKQLDKKYGKNTNLLFNIYTTYIERMNFYLNNGMEYYDLLGEYYENYVTSSNKSSSKGQFFTPEAVTELMTNIVFTNNIETGDTIYDCAGGSGRTLLSAHMKNPKAVCFSCDLDLQACKMCVVNFIVHGVKGVVVNMDSLSCDFFMAWKVHEYVDLFGINLKCVMPVESLDEAECLIGINRDYIPKDKSG